jgi:hypothetical protein
MSNNRLIIVRGIPGSGKTTFANVRFPNCLHLENDMYHVRNGSYEWSAKNQDDAIKWCIDMTIISLRRGMDVVVSNTFTKTRYVDTYRRIADIIGCGFEVYRMFGRFQNVHGLSESLVENFRSGFEDYSGELFVTPEITDKKYTISKEDV